jgi:hypothetical protein
MISHSRKEWKRHKREVSLKLQNTDSQKSFNNNLSYPSLEKESDLLEKQLVDHDANDDVDIDGFQAYISTGSQEDIPTDSQVDTPTGSQVNNVSYNQSNHEDKTKVCCGYVVMRLYCPVPTLH